MWLLAILGCANNIRSLYEQEKAQVLAAPPALGATWEPELRLRFSDDALETLSEAALATGLLKADKKITWEGPLGVSAEISPKLEVKGLKLVASKTCDACLDLTANLNGTGPWKLGSLKGELPIGLEIDGTLSFDVKKQDSAFLVTGRLRDIKHVKVKTDLAGEFDVAKLIQRWGQDLAESVPPFDVGEFGGDEVPLRALRLATFGGALSVEAVTDVAGGEPLRVAAPKLTEGWELAIGDKTLVALMRREAFKTGVIEYDVAVDPRYLEVNGTVFTLGLRLWRLTSRGWWRDYEVTGQFDVLPRAVRLLPKLAKEGDKSKGAGLADPLALLAEGKILQVVEEGLAQSLPSGESAGLGDQELSVRVATVKGMGDALVVAGALELGKGGGGRQDEDGGDKGKGGKRRRSER